VAPPAGLRAEPREPTDRIVEDDQAAHRAAEFRDCALLNQRLAALRLPLAVQGVCANCNERCLPLAVYCDSFCRDDHETRLRLLEIGGHRR
jgi:hypothetical protein